MSTPQNQKSLINNKSKHSFDVEVASKIGIQCAIVLSDICNWVKWNQDEGKQDNYHHGRFWSYRSYPAFVKHFPYWNERQIRTIIEKLLKEELLLVGNFNKLKYDRTSWYTPSDKGLKILGRLIEDSQIDTSDEHSPREDANFEKPSEPTSPLICQKSQMEETKKSDENDENDRPIPTLPSTLPSSQRSTTTTRTPEFKNFSEVVVEVLNNDKTTKLDISELVDYGFDGTHINQLINFHYQGRQVLHDRIQQALNNFVFYLKQGSNAERIADKPSYFFKTFNSTGFFPPPPPFPSNKNGSNKPKEATVDSFMIFDKKYQAWTSNLTKEELAEIHEVSNKNIPMQSRLRTYFRNNIWKEQS